MLFCHKKNLSKCLKVKRVEYAVRKKIKEQKKSAVRSGYII